MNDGCIGVLIESCLDHTRHYNIYTQFNVIQWGEMYYLYYYYYKCEELICSPEPCFFFFLSISRLLMQCLFWFTCLFNSSSGKKIYGFGVLQVCCDNNN